MTAKEAKKTASEGRKIANAGKRIERRARRTARKVKRRIARRGLRWMRLQEVGTFCAHVLRLEPSVQVTRVHQVLQHSQTRSAARRIGRGARRIGRRARRTAKKGYLKSRFRIRSLRL